MNLSILFLVIGAIGIVAAIKDVKLDNLNAPIYFGDSNATVGEPFWIKCVSKQPIEWHKDGKPIREHFVRHSREEFSYTQSDVPKANDIIESTLSVNHALLNHGGSYKCNINFVNSHSLKVVGDLQKVESDEDHLGSREIFTQPEEVTTSLKKSDEDYDHTIYYEDIDSNEITTITASTKHVSHMMEAVRSTTEKFVVDMTTVSSQVEPKVHIDALNDKKNNLLTTEAFHHHLTTSEAPKFHTVISKTLPTSSPKHRFTTKHSLHESLTTSAAKHPKTNENLSNNQTINASKAELNALPTNSMKNQLMIQPKGKLTPEGNGIYKLFDMGKKMELQCKPDSEAEGKKIIWSKDGVEVSKDPELNGIYHIDEKNGIFKVNKALENVAGNYTCSLGNEQHTFNVWARVLVRASEHSYVVENEKVEIICIVKGTNPRLTWEFYNDTEHQENPNFNEIVAGERFQFSKHDDVEDAKLTITNAMKSDRGSYKCIGTSDAMEEQPEDEETKEDKSKSESVGTLRVKDKLAALWPFLGICAEVFVLCTIILIYEKRRNKTDLDESDTDQSPDHRKNDNSDVRHRK